MGRLRQVPARLRALSAAQSDLLIALAIAALTIAELLAGAVHGRERVLGLLLAVPFNLPLAWRRRAPFRALVAMIGMALLAAVVGSGLFVDQGPGSVILTFLVGIASAGRHLEPRPALAGLALSTAGVFAVFAISGELSADSLPWGAAICVLPWLAGRALGNRVGLQIELEARARRLEREREDHARVAVEVERARIARELHAIVAQAVSGMVIQAGAARRAAPEDPATARVAFRAVEQTGRAALAEMRRLLDMLRTEEEEPALAPQPGLGQVDALVDTARAALPVELRVEGDRRGLLPGVDLAAYRVVQDALSAVVRRAEASHASVTIRYGERDVEIEVADDGADPADGDGRGVLAMRERVTLYGGEVRSDREPDGSHRVRARLPRTGRAG
jgi:signal transduction histidine kinase